MLERVEAGGSMIFAPGPNVFHLFHRGIVGEIWPVPRPRGTADRRAQLLSR